MIEKTSVAVSRDHENDASGDLQRRIDELNDLLSINRDLSNALEPPQLYALLSDKIVQRLGFDSAALFIFHNKTRSFELVYQQGTGEVHQEFLLGDISAIWQQFLKKQPLSLVDRNGQPLFPQIIERFHLDRLGAEFLVPLVMRNNVIGFIALGAKAGREPLNEADLYFLRQIAAHAAVCINTSHLYMKRAKEKEELNRTLYNLSLLYSIGRAMTYISDLKSLLKYILNQAIEITGAEKGSIMLYDIEKNLLSIRVLAGLKDKAYQRKVNSNEINCRSFRPGEGIAGRVFQSGRPMVVAKAREEELFIDPDASFVRSIACIPMMVYSDVIGVINVTNKLADTGFTDEDVELLKAVADQAAVAINKAQLWEMAVTDSLTGLFVRRYFMVKFQEEFHRAERYSKILSVVMADIDRFKKINDTYGHTTGDRVLKIIANFFQKNVRDVDIISRYGGEEFVILLPEADKEEAYTVSERLRKKLCELEIDDLPKLSISLGISSYPEDGGDIEMLIKKADAAMYAAKQSGRNRVVIYDKEMASLIREDSVAPDNPAPETRTQSN
jgi:diguanylate cyclase (GGDEF)-like protein